jgi:copper resistance protein C
MRSLNAVTIPRAVSRGIVGALVVLLSVFGLAPAANAHSVLISMSPADGSLVMTAPAKVVFTFNENIQSLGDAVSVVDPTGKQVQSGPPLVLNNTLTEALQPITVPGHYQVAYRVVSADGHPVTKELGFNYLSDVGPTQPPIPPDGGGSSWVTPVFVAAGVLAGVLIGVLIVRRRSSASSNSARE